MEKEKERLRELGRERGKERRGKQERNACILALKSRQALSLLTIDLD